MSQLIVINPLCNKGENPERLVNILKESLKEVSFNFISDAEEFSNTDFTNKKILFTVFVGKSGVNLEYYKILNIMRSDTNIFKNCVGGVIIDGNSQLFTKDVGRDLVFSANNAGLEFIGKPLVEATGSLSNFNVIAKKLNTDNLGAYTESSKDLVSRIMSFKKERIKNPKILAIHAGDKEISNSLYLWSQVEKNLDGYNISELSLHEEVVFDCRGCSFEKCYSLGKNLSCFYDDIIREKFYPAIVECDAVIIICPNKNDAIGAHITSFINRLTSIFLSHEFQDKNLFGIIVSGYSGSDIIAKQLIGSFNLNKSFKLPPHFAITETANMPGSIKEIPDISKRAKAFAKTIIDEFNPCT